MSAAGARQGVLAINFQQLSAATTTSQRPIGRSQPCVGANPAPVTPQRSPELEPQCGQTIHAAVAAIIITNKSVEPANDGLFPNLLAQTWRMK